VLIRPFTSRTYAVATSSSARVTCSHTNPWDANAATMVVITVRTEYFA
jgi:hypothetical protein